MTFQSIGSNGQLFSWAGVKTRVFKDPSWILFFLWYISMIQLMAYHQMKNWFANDTYLFSVIHNVDTSGNELNNNLYQINNFAFQWKMSFNPDPGKPRQEFHFSKKTALKALFRKLHIKNTFVYFLIIDELLRNI